MLRISKLADYATVIMRHLALHSETILSATEIAESIHLPIATVSKILKILAEHKLIKAFRGADGGYQLAHAADTITVAQVIMAIDGHFALTECCHATHECAIQTTCNTKNHWKVINKIIFNALNKVRLTDMTHPTLSTRDLF